MHAHVCVCVCVHVCVHVFVCVCVCACVELTCMRVSVRIATQGGAHPAPNPCTLLFTCRVVAAVTSGAAAVSATANGTADRARKPVDRLSS